MKSPTTEIFSQGEEVVGGEIADTNAAWLAQRLTGLGFEITRHTAVGDRLEALVALLQEIARRTDLCICTGGLGPTVDDLTTEAVSLAFHAPLHLDPDALRQIESYFAASGRNMPSVNQKQALLPAGSQRLDNLWGTAPGFARQEQRCRFYFLPGVPAEMKAMFEHGVLPDLTARFRTAPPQQIVFRTLGLGESALQERLSEIPIPSGARLGFRARAAEVQVKLSLPPGFEDQRLAELITPIVEALGERVFSIGRPGSTAEDLASLVGRLLREKRQTVSIVESLSAGRLAIECDDRIDLQEATLVTQTGAVNRLFGMVLPEPLDDAGWTAASLTLADALRQRSGADHGLAQLVAFDAARSAGLRDPVLVHYALASPDGLHHETHRVSGTRDRRQRLAAAIGLDLLRRHLLKPR